MAGLRDTKRSAKTMRKVLSITRGNSAEKKVTGYHRSAVAKKMLRQEKPDLYLDVDGVLLFYHEYNHFLLNFIADNVEKFHRLFWLSAWTHNGDSDQLLKAHPIFEIIQNIKAVKWNELKTEAIDWSRPFVWIEDGILVAEREIFNQRAIAGQNVWEVRPGEWAMNHRENQKCKSKA
jgi:hypothetical protein